MIGSTFKLRVPAGLKPRGAFIVMTALAATCLCLAVPGALRAADPPLPTAEVIIGKYIAALGGEAAQEKFRTRVIKGTLQFQQGQIQLPMTIHQARPNKEYILIESEQFGNMEDGTDGQTAWSVNARTGARIKEGEERALSLRRAVFDGAIHWRKLYRKAECVGLETVSSQPCHKVVMTPAEGNAENHYFDIETNLLVKIGTSLKTDTGTMPVEIRLSDYKAVDGMMYPHSRRVIFGIQGSRFVTDRIEHNVELPADRFDLPESVQALLNPPEGEDAESESPAGEQADDP